MGAIGETVLTGQRRPATHTAVTACEVLTLTKSALVEVLTKKPAAGLRIVNILMGEGERKRRLQTLVMRFVIASCKPGSDQWAALIIQKAWKRTAHALTSRDEKGASSCTCPIAHAHAHAHAPTHAHPRMRMPRRTCTVGQA